MSENVFMWMHADILLYKKGPGLQQIFATIVKDNKRTNP